MCSIEKGGRSENVRGAPSESLPICCNSFLSYQKYVILSLQYLSSLESRLQQYNSENERLKEENNSLKRKLDQLVSEVMFEKNTYIYIYCQTCFCGPLY